MPKGARMLHKIIYFSSLTEESINIFSLSLHRRQEDGQTIKYLLDSLTENIDYDYFKNYPTRECLVEVLKRHIYWALEITINEQIQDLLCSSRRPLAFLQRKKADFVFLVKIVNAYLSPVEIANLYDRAYKALFAIRRRYIIERYFLGEKSTPEISAELDISVARVNQI
jgi:hypothetical protein